MVPSTPDRVLVDRRGAAGWITFNRPDQMNPLDWGTVRALATACAALEGDPTVRAIVFTGTGRAFSAGGDLRGYLDLYTRPDDFREYLVDFARLLDALERSPKAAIAAVNGHCVAGGLELLLACDLVVASETARIGDAHLNFGQLPGAGGSQRLPRTIGALRAKQLFFTGETLTAHDAERIGLVNAVVPPDRLEAAVAALVEQIAAKSPEATRAVKYLVNEGRQRDLPAALALERDYVHRYATTSPDAMEGLRAFAAKRPPSWTGS